MYPKHVVNYRYYNKNMFEINKTIVLWGMLNDKFSVCSETNIHHFHMCNVPSFIFNFLGPDKSPMQTGHFYSRHMVPQSDVFFLSFLYRASFQHMEWKPTDVTILFVYCWISTCFGPTGPSSGEFVQLVTQPLVQFLCRSVRMLCMLWPVLVTIL